MDSCDATSVSSSLKGNNQYWVREAGSHMGKKSLWKCKSLQFLNCISSKQSNFEVKQQISIKSSNTILNKIYLEYKSQK